MPNTVDEWLEMARGHEDAARHLLVGPDTSRSMVVHHVGTCIECALKAAIMRKEGLNRWPDAMDPGGYWTHDLNKLRAKLGWKISHTDPVAPNWQVVITWTRAADYTYSPKPMPAKVAASYLEAAFGPDGVFKWVMSKLT